VPQPKHLVVLMLENRSFDHMLGWLQRPDYDIDGLDGTQFNLDASGAQVFATRDADFSGDYSPDVAHDFSDVREQVYGTGTAPAMGGFVTNYGKISGNVGRSHHVMKCFDPKKVPVLTTLAQEYAVCTNWFSSVPGPTLPNRAYAHAATSVGHVDMTINWWKETKTVYELLVEHGHSAKIYYHDATMAQTFGGMIDRQDDFFVPNFNDFFEDCKHNRLPDYCFLEPQYNATEGDDPTAASDQHPDHDVSEGEQLIHDVYNAIRGNPETWNNTLLAIVYDEHGGLYDHAAPPAGLPYAVNPDGMNSVDPPFAFDRLGVRVPAVLVSPFIEAGTIDATIYDHTSLIATARKLFLDDWQTTFLTERDRAANTFEDVMTRDAARTDTVDVSGKHTLAMAGHPLTMQQRALVQAAQPLTIHQQALAGVMATAAIETMTQSQASGLHQLLNAALQPAAGAKGAGR
jgi:phospholipase C